jgi:ribonucrease Y
MNILINIVVALIALGAGAAVGYTQLLKRRLYNIERKKEKAEEMIQKAQEEAVKIKEEASVGKKELEKRTEESIEMNQKLVNQMEASVKNKEQSLSKQEQKINQLKLRLAEMEEEMSVRKKSIERLDKQALEKLALKSGKTESEIHKEIVNRYEKELAEENEQKLTMILENTKEKSQRTAQKIIVNAIQRLCSPTAAEPRSVHVKVKKDIVKGKIVGKGAQNIMYFEELLDVDVVFNDLPKTISVSAFNLVNRRIAHTALETLVNTRGEIDKGTVKTAVDNAKKEVDKELFKIGKNMVDKVGLRDLDEELIRTIGRLQFRTSYSQNIMRHSMEVGYLATMMGSEIGLNLQTCKVGGFLHDLGKAIDQNPDVQGTHDFLTKELMEKYGFSKEEIHAAWTHHESEKPSTPEALMVQAADALSASRPGARQESLEKYLERLKALEETTASFEGVKKTFAISAGREIRAIVDPTIVEDKNTQELANKIAAEIEANLAYPGKIKVNIIRKTKTIEIAK